MDLRTAQPWVELPAAAVPDSDFGLKACNLVRLSRLSDRLGFDVPAGFLVPPSVLDEAWAALGLSAVAAADRYASIVQHGDVAAAEAWRQRVDAMDLPPSAATRLQQHYRALTEHCGSPTVVVRSSFYAEDSTERSCAGLFTSVRNVSGAEALCRAVRTVYASLFAARTVRYLSAARRPLAPRMAVIVQRMIGGPGWVGGVAHSRAPDLATHDLLLIAASPELTASPRARRAPRSISCTVPTCAAAGPRSCTRPPGPPLRPRASRLTSHRSVPWPRSSWISSTRSGTHWRSNGRGRPTGGCSSSRPGRCQPWPTPGRPSRVPVNIRRCCRRLAVGHGEFTGTVRRVDAVEEGAHLGPQDVLVTRRTDADWDSALARVGAVITASGGRTSHTARLARERRFTRRGRLRRADRSATRR